jgi:hypothetical protein
LTLDEDVSNLLRKEMKRRGVPFKTAVNHFLRLGLREAAVPQNRNFEIKPFRLRVPASLQFDCIGELLEELEGPEHR